MRSTAVPLDFEQLEKLFDYIIRALLWVHWSVQLEQNDLIKVMALTSAGEQYFDNRFFGVQVQNRIKKNLGSGTVSYEGVQGVDDKKTSAWRLPCAA